jgi:hypothetical protein
MHNKNTNSFSKRDGNNMKTRIRMFYVLVFCTVALLFLQTRWSLGRVHPDSQRQDHGHAVVDHLRSTQSSVVVLTTAAGVAPANAPVSVPTAVLPSRKSSTDAPVLRPTTTNSATARAAATAADDSALAQPLTGAPMIRQTPAPALPPTNSPVTDKPVQSPTATPKSETTVKSLTFSSDRGLVEPKDVDDIYSGMWWQSVQSFLPIDFSVLVNLEGATFRVGNTHWGRLRMARDMLDFGVEHISFLMKFFRFGSNYETMSEATRAAHDILLRKLRQYAYNVFYESPFASLESPPAFRSTIAVIPFGYQNRPQSNDARQFDPDYEVKHESLRATLASIWQLGVGRAVVVGGDGAAVAQLFDEFRSTVTKTSVWNVKLKVRPPTMELAFIDYPASKNIPKAALMALQQALSPVSSDGASDVKATLQWLGTTDKAKWKHVYYSEPDLVLHTTPRVITELAQALEANNVLFAHRFNFVAHASDFPPDVVGATKTMPAVGRYANVPMMDPYDADDKCIWTSQDRDALKVKDCPDYWHQCGFHEKFGGGTAEEVEHAFRLYEPFQLMRLKHGVGFTMASGTEIRNICEIHQKS